RDVCASDGPCGIPGITQEHSGGAYDEADAAHDPTARCGGCTAHLVGVWERLTHGPGRGSRASDRVGFLEDARWAGAADSHARWGHADVLRRCLVHRYGPNPGRPEVGRVRAGG